MPSLNELGIRFLFDDHGPSLPSIGRPVFLTQDGAKSVNREYFDDVDNDSPLSTDMRLIVGEVPFDDPNDASHFPQENLIWLQSLDGVYGFLVPGSADLFEEPAG
jgi:hypothetical protein